MTSELNATVVQRIEVSPGLVILRVVPESWELPDFTPGQFAVLGLPGRAARCTVCDPEDEPAEPNKLIKRAYSIASSSVANDGGGCRLDGVAVLAVGAGETASSAHTVTQSEFDAGRLRAIDLGQRQSQHAHQRS